MNDLVYANYGSDVETLKDFDWSDLKPLGFCVLEGATFGEKAGLKCVAKTAKDICKNSVADDKDVYCEIAESYANHLIDEKVPGSNDTPPEMTQKEKQDEARQQARLIESAFGEIDCKNLTSSQKSDLTDRLNRTQLLFLEAGLDGEFTTLLNNLTCDVKSEFGCPIGSSKVIQFSPKPICKTNSSSTVLKSWGIPIVAGGSVGAASHFIFNWSVPVSVLIGGATFGITKYFLRDKEA